jgi:hypothetical protein
VVVGGSDGGERRGRTMPVGGENGVGEEKGGNERVRNLSVSVSVSVSPTH